MIKIIFEYENGKIEKKEFETSAEVVDYIDTHKDIKGIKPDINRREKTDETL